MTVQPTYPWEAPSTGNALALSDTLRARLPRFETGRLIVRPPEIGDFETYREILMTKRAVFMVDVPHDRRSAWLDFTQCVAGWQLHGHGLFVIEAKGSGETLGFTVICMEYGDREPELGWFLTETAEGQGYAFEAAQAVRAWGLATLKLPALVSYIDPLNTRSIRLAERLGGWRDGIASAELSEALDEDVLVYRHWPKPNPEAQP